MPRADKVEAYIWGAESSDDNTQNKGIMHTMEQLLWGGNVGHAAIKLSLADTPENTALVQKYLHNTGVHVQTKHYETRSSGDNTIAYQEDVIEVYFSWWPSGSDSYRFSSYNEDCIHERIGVHVEANPDIGEIPQEKRMTHGLLGKREIALGTKSVLHMAGLSEQEAAYAQAYQKGVLLAEDLTALLILADKIKVKSTKESLSKNDKFLIERFFPGESLENMTEFSNAVSQKLDTVKQLQQDSEYEYIMALVNLNGSEGKKQFELAPEELEISEQNENLGNILTYLKGDVIETRVDFLGLSYMISGKSLDYLCKLKYVDANGVEKNLIEKDENNQMIIPVNIPEVVAALKARLEQDTDPNNPSSFASRAEGVKSKYRIRSVLECVERAEACHDLIDSINVIKALSPDSDKSVMISDINKKLQEDPLKGSFPFILVENNIHEVLNAISQFLVDEKKSILNMSAEDRKILESQYGRRVLDNVSFEGRDPDDTVTLPIKTLDEPGLDAEKMLKTMAEFATSGQAFNLVSNNCSVTTSTILSAAADPQRSPIFERYDFEDAIATPQNVRDNAIIYISSLIDPNYIYDAQGTAMDVAKALMAQDMRDAVASVQANPKDVATVASAAAVFIPNAIGYGTVLGAETVAAGLTSASSYAAAAVQGLGSVKAGLENASQYASNGVNWATSWFTKTPEPAPAAIGQQQVENSQKMLTFSFVPKQPNVSDENNLQNASVNNPNPVELSNDKSDIDNLGELDKRNPRKGSF